jgi:uncharacterized protein (DUF885 family)
MIRKLLCVAMLGVGSAAFADDSAVLKSTSETLFAEFCKASPSFATAMGIHDYDGKLDPVDRQAHKAFVTLLENTLAALSPLDPKSLSQTERDDREILIAFLKGQLREETEIQSWRHNPDQYVGLGFGAVNGLITRAFDTPEARLRSVIARENAMPKMLKDAKSNLADMPPIFIDIALEDLEGGLNFIEKNVPEAFAGVKDRKLAAGLKASTAKAVAALKDFKAFLVKEKPKAHGQFALGRDNFIGLLHNDLIDATPEQVLAAGQAQLERDRAAWDEVSKQIDPDHPDQAFAEIEAEHPSADKLLATAKDQLVELRRFVEERHIVTLPYPIMPKVEETPEFQRAVVFGEMDWPGPFETKATESYYYITPPEASAPADEQEKFLRLWNYPTLRNLTVHEAMPGHFVQGLYLKAHPEWSVVRKAINSYSDVEGWAHYSEQMMIEQGMEKGDPKARIAQLGEALLRDCRLIDAVSMHVLGMTLEEATATMREKCHVPEAEAYKEARRGTSDPGYFSYTLGKLAILKLRADLQAKEGANFSLQSFHDRFLAAGPVPIKVIRREIMGEDGPLL